MSLGLLELLLRLLELLLRLLGLLVKDAVVGVAVRFHNLKFKERSLNRFESLGVFLFELNHFFVARKVNRSKGEHLLPYVGLQVVVGPNLRCFYLMLGTLLFYAPNFGLSCEQGADVKRLESQGLQDQNKLAFAVFFEVLEG